MITLQNITNAFVKLGHDNRVFLADPWITDGIFDGGWAPYPPVKAPEAALNRCDYLYISHIHEDHFDLEAIAHLPRDCTILIPDLFPNQIIKEKLTILGFNNFRLLQPLKPITLAADLTVELIPPLNSFGQEFNYYGKGSTPVAIDTGIMLVWDGIKIVLLNDNSPYDLSSVASSLSRLGSPHLLALNYNGAADDYPVCYRGLTPEDKEEISNARDRRKLEANLRLISALKPRALMMYSSELSVRGRQAHAFVRSKPSMFVDKSLMATHVEQCTGIPTFALFEDDVLEIDAGGSGNMAGQYPYQTLMERAVELYSQVPNYASLFPAVTDLESLRDDFQLAVEHLFRYMNSYGWTSEWILEVNLEEDPTPLCVDFQSQNAVEAPIETGRKVLRCFTDARYFNALLHRLTHWNNAMISYNLEWERNPNEYDPLLYKALNFLHL